MRFYIDEGARLRRVVDELLPRNWRWEGKRMLDFGCGSARVLRHFASEAVGADLVGCDIDGPSIEWAQSRLSPPFRFFRNEPTPPLDLRAQSLDLILAMSVFTHIGDGWAAWLTEMHRLLAPDGLLLASFLGEGVWEALVGEAYREDEVGMAVLRSWDGQDAWVFHSEWWLREHWGRAFEVVQIRRPPRGANGAAEVTHSHILGRKRDTQDIQVDPEALERLDPHEERELAGLQTSLRLARRDIAYLCEHQSAAVRQRRLSRGLRNAGRALKRRLPPSGGR